MPVVTTVTLSRQRGSASEIIAEVIIPEFLPRHVVEVLKERHEADTAYVKTKFSSSDIEPVITTYFI